MADLKVPSKQEVEDARAEIADEMATENPRRADSDPIAKNVIVQKRAAVRDAERIKQEDADRRNKDLSENLVRVESDQEGRLRPNPGEVILAKCPTCEGTGAVPEIIRRDHTGVPVVEKWSNCPRCGASGGIPASILEKQAEEAEEAEQMEEERKQSEKDTAEENSKLFRTGRSTTTGVDIMEPDRSDRKALTSDPTDPTRPLAPPPTGGVVRGPNPDPNANIADAIRKAEEERR